MSGTLWDARIRDTLGRVVDEGRWRSPREFDALGPVGVVDGAPVVSFASNDYLGLSSHPAVVAAAHEALERWGAGSGASRLVTGTRPIHSDLELALADWKGTEAAVCFPTGFAANLGVLCTLGGPGVRVLSDELNHASIIDGCRLSRASLAVYRHRDLDHLEELLSAAGTAAGARSAASPTIVVTDTVFSMDGDAAPVDELVTLCARHGALLVLDEAHAILGPSAPTATPGADGAVIVRVGTLSKTLGSLGGFVAASRDVVDLLVNRARPYIFSTAPPRPTPPRRWPRSASCGPARGLSSWPDWPVSSSESSTPGWRPPGHPSPIIPVVLGSETRALEASAALLAEGLWVPAIRPPTVPAGTSRLRVTLSAAHRDADAEHLLDALARLRRPMPATL